METNHTILDLLPQPSIRLTEEFSQLAPPETSTRDHIDSVLDYLEEKQKI